MQLIIFVEKNSVIEKGFKNVNLKHWKSKFEMTRGCQDSLIRQDLLRVLPPFQTFQKSPTSKLACLNINQNTFFIFQFLKIQQNTLWFLKTKTCTWEMAEGLVDLMVLELTKHFWQPGFTFTFIMNSWTPGWKYPEFGSWANSGPNVNISLAGCK